jgi:hypothetical protein
MLNRHGQMIDLEEIVLNVLMWIVVYPVVGMMLAGLIFCEGYLLYALGRWLISCL